MVKKNFIDSQGGGIDGQAAIFNVYITFLRCLLQEF